MAGRPQRPLVLIIDEEETVRELYGHWFFALGFEVMCASAYGACRWPFGWSAHS